MPTRKVSDLDAEERCLNPEHEPPKHMVYSDGVWEHVCPGCGKKTTFVVRNPIYSSRGIPQWAAN